MKFVICRSSTWDKKPCKEAKKMKVENWHTRTIKSPEEFDKRFGEDEGKWLSKGKNHTITKKGWITRQEEDIEEWCIELASLADLGKLFEKYGQLILSQYSNSNPHIVQYEVEIYDSWRE